MSRNSDEERAWRRSEKNRPPEVFDFKQPLQIVHLSDGRYGQPVIWPGDVQRCRFHKAGPNGILVYCVMSRLGEESLEAFHLDGWMQIADQADDRPPGRCSYTYLRNKPPRGQKAEPCFKTSGANSSIH